MGPTMLTARHRPSLPAPPLAAARRNLLPPSPSFSFHFRPSHSRISIAHANIICCAAKASGKPILQSAAVNDAVLAEEAPESKFSVSVGSPSIGAAHNLQPLRLSLSDQAFYLLAFTACTTCVAFTSLVVAAVPTLYAMSRAAISLSKLADTACEELPSTMAAIRLTGMEISDLTLELSDLSQEIVDGVSKSAQAVQAADAGVRQIGSLAHQQTMSMIQERASLPIISLQPVVAGAAKKTSRAVGQATRRFMNIISGGEHDSDIGEDSSTIDRIEL